jgi:hypothetical protein
LTGDAAATDPACALSPQHELIVLARRASTPSRALVPLVYRRKNNHTGKG